VGAADTNCTRAGDIAAALMLLLPPSKKKKKKKKDYQCLRPRSLTRSPRTHLLPLLFIY